MITLNERVDKFESLFCELQLTNSRVDKELTIAQFKETYPELVDDLVYILETLDNRHPIGWTFIPLGNAQYIPFHSIREVIEYCEKLKRKDAYSTAQAEMIIGMKLGSFITPIVNRTLRLGIGKSLLPKAVTTPMLAKKFDGIHLNEEIGLTEKLDGNRCIASFVNGTWQFTSRSGKPLAVNFDMTGLPTEFIYDGEILSVDQTKMSIDRSNSLLHDGKFKDTTEMWCDFKESQLLFNKTSGLINRKGPKSGLVYNIFDVINNQKYFDRRANINELIIDGPEHDDIRFLPMLYQGKSVEVINNFLSSIVDMGGEGVMLNKMDGSYQHKRSDALLKYKQVQFMDMLVTDVYDGEGKYEGLVGGLYCEINTAEGLHIKCKVGSGLSDTQRTMWAIDKSKIVGKIVQVGYHELTQNAEDIGTNDFSLRFPRLIKIRTDKNSTSEY